MHHIYNEICKGVKFVDSFILYKRFSSLEINITMNINVSIFMCVCAYMYNVSFLVKNNGFERN